ncbi:unnamed protein product, partial [Ectocarpus sp. 6 AP-2014]
MVLSWKVVSLLVGAISAQWRHGGGGAYAAVLSSYPGYCAKDMDLNSIPSLDDSVQASFGGGVSLDDVELLQVHAMIRHGARGPYTKPRCWEGYAESWDCNVTEVVSPSLSADDGGVGATGLFRKLYDAYPSDNALSGTCMAGQLLDEGYEQEQANGRHLRDAYLCGNPSCLAAANATAKQLQDSGALYLRSDDEQRTVMSGQILTASMLNVSGAVLDWHTGDDQYDYLAPNLETCPRLGELSGEALNDPSWIEVTSSWENTALNESMTSVWEQEVVWWDVLDCLMTTACTGRELPEELTDEVFAAAVDFSTQTMVQEASFNDAAYGKLAMAKLTREIRERMAGAMNGTSPLKFILLSGHDTTFIPLMAAVAPSAWDGTWPRYATLASIELLRIGGGGSESGYNGQVLRLEGCDQDICAMEAFLDATRFSVDIQDDTDHCCCRNMTQASVDNYEEGKEDGAGAAAETPAPTILDETNVAESALAPGSSNNGS